MFTVDKICLQCDQTSVSETDLAGKWKGGKVERRENTNTTEAYDSTQFKRSYVAKSFSTQFELQRQQANA